jgi:hypothetical protein
MTPTPPAPPPCLGFLTVAQDGGGFLGGYLVTNLWGRPLEFRLSTAVVPNKVQQILYGPTLGVYLSADLIGKTLIEKTATPARLVLTDTRDVLELRHSLDIPVAWVAPPADSEASGLAALGLAVREAGPGRGAVLVHPDFPGDVAACAELFNRMAAGLDVAEPFARIRDAVAEARKMGVTRQAG